MMLPMMMMTSSSARRKGTRVLVEDDASERSLYALFRVQNAEAILQRVAAI